MERDEDFRKGDLVAIKGDPYIIWKIIDRVSETSGKLRGPGVKMIPAHWATGVIPAGEMRLPTHRLRHVSEMEVLAVVSR